MTLSRDPQHGKPVAPPRHPAPGANAHAGHRYEQQMEAALRFLGQEHHAFLEQKAEHVIRIIRRHLGSSTSVALLDVGCGVGLMDQLLTPMLDHVTGIDVSEEVVTAARQTNPGATYLTYDGATMPFADATFDAALIVNVLHHIPPPDRLSVIREMTRCLRPGGVCIAAEHNPLNPLTRLVVARCEFDHDAILLPRQETASLMSSAGLIHLLHQYVVFTPYYRSWLVTAEQRLGRLPLGAQYIVASQKPAQRSAHFQSG